MLQVIGIVGEQLHIEDAGPMELRKKIRRGIGDRTHGIFRVLDHVLIEDGVRLLKVEVVHFVEALIQYGRSFDSLTLSPRGMGNGDANAQGKCSY